jgi:hypothetical protein
VGPRQQYLEGSRTHATTRGREADLHVGALLGAALWRFLPPVAGIRTEFFLFQPYFQKMFTFGPPEILYTILDPKLGAMGCGAEITHLGTVICGAELADAVADVAPSSVPQILAPSYDISVRAVSSSFLSFPCATGCPAAHLRPPRRAARRPPRRAARGPCASRRSPRRRLPPCSPSCRPERRLAPARRRPTPCSSARRPQRRPAPCSPPTDPSRARATARAAGGCPRYFLNFKIIYTYLFDINCLVSF